MNKRGIEINSDESYYPEEIKRWSSKIMNSREDNMSPFWRDLVVDMYFRYFVNSIVGPNPKERFFVKKSKNFNCLILVKDRRDETERKPYVIQVQYGTDENNKPLKRATCETMTRKDVELVERILKNTVNDFNIIELKH